MSSAVDQMQTHSQNLIHLNNTDNTNCANGDWFDVLSKAEQVVKYPTSFLSLRFLLKDEISYLAIHLKRLIDTKHPLLQTAKTILSTNQQIRGLVVLLLSKAYSYPKHILDNYDSETNRLAIISKCQRKLAEITDMIHVSQVLHRGVVDIPVPTTHDHFNTKANEDLQLGNTISVLIGDFLLAQSSRGLALIRNPTITGLMAKAIGNYSEAEFLRSQLLKQYEGSEGLKKYCYLSGGSLLGHSCKSAILLAQFGPQIQTEAFDIGRHIGIAFQLSDLLYRLLSADNKSTDFGDELLSIDTNLVKSLLESSLEKAIDLIHNLDKSEATEALTDIVLNIENVQNINDFQ